MQKNNRDLSILIAIFFTFVWALFIHSRAYSGNDFSRMASVESLVHRGTWQIDESPFTTIDRIKVGENFYSDKPPGLAFIAAGVYWFFYRAGITLQASGCVPENLTTHCRAVLEWQTADHAHFFLTLLLISSCATLLLVLLYRLGKAYKLPLHWNLLLIGGIGLGSAIFPYSTVFTNHVPSALGIFIPLYLFLTNKTLSHKQYMLAGFAVSMAVTVDLSAGVYAVAYLVYIFWRYPKKVHWYVLGCVPPALLLIALDYQIVGNPFPPQLYAEGYRYEGSGLYGNISGFSRSDNMLWYGFQMLFGVRGVFMFYPILLWFMVAAVRAGRQKRTKSLVMLTLIATVLYTLYFVLSTNNFGGYAYSPRWLLNPVPVIAAFAFVQPQLYQSARQIIVLSALTIFSIISTYNGALNPWSIPDPVLYIGYAPRQTSAFEEIPLSLSGYREYAQVDRFLRKGIDLNHVILRRFDARSAFVIPNETGWWFVHQSTPIAPEFTAALGVELPGNSLSKLTLHPQADEWLASATKTIFISSELVPTQVPETASLPVVFSDVRGDLALVGFSWQQADDALVLLTGWRVITQSAYQLADRRIFVHMLNDAGQIVSQHDQLSADYTTLRPDDFLFQIHRLPLDSAPLGDYWIQIGVYYPQNGERIYTLDQADRALLMPFDIPVTE